MSVIDVNVTETGVAGEVQLDIVTPELMNISIMTMTDGIAAPYVGNWSSLGTVMSPGTFELSLPNETWSLLQCVGVYESEIVLGKLLRVYPISREVSYEIDIVRESISEYVVGRTSAYRLRMSTRNAVGLPPEVFLYEQAPAEALTRQMRDSFVSVCKPGDLETYPADSPNPEQVPPFYRLSTVDIVDESIYKLEEVADAIVKDVQELVGSLEANHQLQLDSIHHVTPELREEV